MALYAIGDIQGCHTEFCQLLDLIGFSSREDRLWLVGDIVNRGPQSLAVLREVIALGDAATTVLGNHDFHLLTVAAGHRPPHRDDTVEAILAAPDRDQALDWLARRPLVVVDEGRLLVHAGLLPQWTPATALMLSREVEAMMASERRQEFLGMLYGDEPRTWRDDLDGYDRLRVIVNAFTRLRFCTADGTMELSRKARPRARARRLSSLVRAREPPQRRRDDRLRPLVDARSRARAQHDDARFGLLVGRSAYRGAPSRPSRVPGAVASAGSRKAARIARSASRARSRRCRSPAASAGGARSSTTSARAPVTRQNDFQNESSPT